MTANLGSAHTSQIRLLEGHTVCLHTWLSKCINKCSEKCIADFSSEAKHLVRYSAVAFNSLKILCIVVYPWLVAAVTSTSFFSCVSSSFQHSTILTEILGLKRP